MKTLEFKKKNLIAMALAVVVACSGFVVSSTHAAEKIDENRQCTITIQIPTATSINANTNNGKIADGAILCETDVTIDFYKIADVNIGGSYENKLSGVDFTLIEKDDPTADDMEKFANSASGAVNNAKPDYSFKINPTKKFSITENIARGLYLYIPHCEDSNRYKFTFTKSVISVPTSHYIQQATVVGENGLIVDADDNSDEWIYDVSIAIKSEAEQRYGYLRIDKTLASFNESLGAASFVYDVEATLDGELIFSNVYSLNMYDADEDSIWIADSEGFPILPADAEVTVTEVCTGASYKMTASSYSCAEDGRANINIIQADKTIVASFTNDYNDEIDVGTISIENHFGAEGFISEEETPVEVVPEQVAR